MGSCNCRVKEEGPLYMYQKTDVMYKCVVSTNTTSNKVDLGTAEGCFKKRYNKQKTSFKNRHHENHTKLFKYIWEMRDKYHHDPALKWSVVKRVPPYSNITKRSMLCLQEKF